MDVNNRGFSLPFRIDPHSGGVTQAAGPGKLKENLVHLLLTQVGERAMRRGYGGGLRELLHDPNNDALRLLAERQIFQAIGQWEPRVLVEDVSVTQQGATLVADIRYRVRPTLERDDLQVPIVERTS